MVPALKMQKVQHCLHEHWKNCLDYPEVHMFVKQPSGPEEEDLVEPEEQLHIAQLVSNMCSFNECDTGLTTGMLQTRD
jgi:hypothetical protein